MLPRFQDFLATGRVANLPGVVSNVLLGILAACLLVPGSVQQLSFVLFSVPVLAACLLYLGGCFLNDWKDREHDALHRPERPLPSGRTSPSAVLALALALTAFALAASFACGSAAFVTAILITASMLAYTWLHKKTAWAVLPMAACRALLYPLGFLAALGIRPAPAVPRFHCYLPSSGLDVIASFADGRTPRLVLSSAYLLLPLMAGLAAYIAGLSLLARHESGRSIPRANKILAVFLLLLPALTHSAMLLKPQALAVSLALLLFIPVTTAAILLAGKNIRKGVSLLLAAIPLIDFIVLASFFQADPAIIRQNHSIVLFSYPLLAVPMALLLQKSAPAT